jgi:hypothetical protein
VEIIHHCFWVWPARQRQSFVTLQCVRSFVHSFTFEQSVTHTSECIEFIHSRSLMSRCTHTVVCVYT